MLRCLLDTGCSKSIVLKKFTDKKQRSKLDRKDTVRYTTYGGNFVSTETVTLPIQMVEFNNEVSSHEFQVDAQETGGKYDMIIGLDIMEEQGVGILYSDHCIVRDGVRVPLKLQGELSDGKYCEHIANVCTICIRILSFYNRWKNVKVESLMRIILKLISMKWLMDWTFKVQVSRVSSLRSRSFLNYLVAVTEG